MCSENVPKIGIFGTNFWNIFGTPTDPRRNLPHLSFSLCWIPDGSRRIPDDCSKNWNFRNEFLEHFRNTFIFRNELFFGTERIFSSCTCSCSCRTLPLERHNGIVFGTEQNGLFGTDYFSERNGTVHP